MCGAYALLLLVVVTKKPLVVTTTIVITKGSLRREKVPTFEYLLPAFTGLPAPVMTLVSIPTSRFAWCQQAQRLFFTAYSIACGGGQRLSLFTYGGGK